MKYGNRLQITNEFMQNTNPEELERAISKQVRELLEDIYIKEGGLKDRTYVIKLYLTNDSLLKAVDSPKNLRVDFISNSLEVKRYEE